MPLKMCDGSNSMWSCKNAAMLQWCPMLQSSNLFQYFQMMEHTQWVHSVIWKYLRRSMVKLPSGMQFMCVNWIAPEASEAVYRNLWHKIKTWIIEVKVGQDINWGYCHFLGCGWIVGNVVGEWEEGHIKHSRQNEEAIRGKAGSGTGQIV